MSFRTPGSRMSRTVTLVLLSGVMLTTCCCLLRPRDEPQYDENGNPIPPEQRATSSGYRRSSWGWGPVLWSSGSRGWGGSSWGRSSSWGGGSTGGTRVGGGGSVKTGGFGSSAGKFGGGGSSS